jgi:hypothetical protein
MKKEYPKIVPFIFRIGKFGLVSKACKKVEAKVVQI